VLEIPQIFEFLRNLLDKSNKFFRVLHQASIASFDIKETLRQQEIAEAKKKGWLKDLLEEYEQKLSKKFEEKKT